MFLYFYEAKMIVGFNSQIPNQWLKECDEFDINDKKEDDHWFNGWETEENEDGTFYLVFITRKKIKYYLIHSLLRLTLVQMYDDKGNAQKLVFDDEGTTIKHYNEENEEYKLHLIKNKNNMPDIYLADSKYDDGVFSNKVCLTETSNLNSYVLK
jgi:hypothetical protein